MSTFSDIAISEIRTDCRHYSGYKPCHKSPGCPGCESFEARGEQVLVIKLGAMGDVLRTKSLLPALKRAHPESWIAWLTNPGSEPLVRDPLVDEIRPLTVEGMLALEGRRWARVLCLDKDAHAVAFARRCETKLRQGFAATDCNTVTVANEASAYALRLGLSDELKYRLNRKSVPEILHEMAELPYDGAEYSLHVPDAARVAAGAVLARLGVPRGEPLIGINTGCGPVFETKAWTREGFADLIARLARGGANVLLLGGERERALHAELMRHATPRVFDAGNANSLETFFALVDACSLVVTADTMALHVAIALRKQVVAFFGPTCEQEVDLFGRGEKIVTDFACSPCYLKRCDKDPTCMQALSAETVEGAVRRAMAKPGAP